ncbi:hypothetical protein Hanom_Chr16g01460651 [Helianthus anomalus]
MSKGEKQALVVALVAEVRFSREEGIARRRLDEVYQAFKDVKQAKRWDDERKCYLNPQGNPTVDPMNVDFDALLAAIPTFVEFYSKIKVDKNLVEEVEKHIEKVINASLEKSKETLKKNDEETIDESQKKMTENLKKTTDKTMMADQTKVKTQNEY